MNFDAIATRDSLPWLGAIQTQVCRDLTSVRDLVFLVLPACMSKHALSIPWSLNWIQNQWVRLTRNDASGVRRRSTVLRSLRIPERERQR